MTSLNEQFLQKGGSVTDKVMHEFPIDLVQKELDGDATPEDLIVLASNKKLWRQHLSEMKARTTGSMLAKKSESMNKGYMNHGAMAEFQEWKRRAVYFLGLVDKRLGLIKEQIKTENRAKAAEGGDNPMWDRQHYLLEAILEELEGIRDLMIDAKPALTAEATNETA